MGWWPEDELRQAAWGRRLRARLHAPLPAGAIELQCDPCDETGVCECGACVLGALPARNELEALRIASGDAPPRRCQACVEGKKTCPDCGGLGAVVYVVGAA